MVKPCVSCNPQLSSVQEEELSVFPSYALAMARKEKSVTVRADGNETPCSDTTVKVDTPNVNGQVHVLREAGIFPQQLEGNPTGTTDQV